MRNLISFAVTLVCLAMGGQAGAAPVSLTLTLSPASGATLVINALGSLTASAASSLSGTQDITLYEATPYSNFLTFDGGDIALSDQSLFIDLDPFGGVVGGFKGVNVELESNGLIPLNYAFGSFVYGFDPGDPAGSFAETVLRVQDGVLTYLGTGSLGQLLGSGTLDYTNDTFDFTLPPLGQIGTLTQTLLSTTGGTSSYQVVLSVPASVSERISSNPAIEGTVYFNLLATGTYMVVPEPSTALLAVIALAALVPLARRWRSS